MTPFVVVEAVAAVGTSVSVIVPVPVACKESPVGTFNVVIVGPVFPKMLVIPTFDVPKAAVNRIFTTPGVPVVTTSTSIRSPAAH